MSQLFKVKKIAIVMENFLYGGATTHLINLLNSKTLQEIEFIIITNRGNLAVKNIINTCDTSRIKFVYFHSLNDFILSNIFLKILFLILKPILFFISIIQMYLIIRKYNFDVLLADCGGYGDFRSEMASIFAARILGLRQSYLLIHHCYQKPRIWGNIVNLFNILIGKYINGLIFVSHATRLTIKENTKLFNYFKKGSIVIHNGVLLKKIRNKKFNKIFKTKKGILKVGMLSRIEEYKGQLDLVDGFSNLPDKIKEKFKIFFVGSGTSIEVKYLKERIKDHNLNRYFKIIKYLNLDSLTILKNFDVLVSLTRDFEGFGYSVAEALYVGTPVISTRVGGMVEFLNDKNSKLINPMDIKSITKSLEDFTKQKHKWKQKTYSGKKLIIKKFNSENMSKSFLKYIQKQKKF